jgi:hypothetical protein
LCTFCTLKYTKALKIYLNRRTEAEPFSNERSSFSFLLGSLLEPQFLLQLHNIILKVLVDLLQKPKLKEDFVVHEKRGKDERYLEWVIVKVASTSSTHKETRTSEQVVQQSGGAALMDTMSIELSQPT